MKFLLQVEAGTFENQLRGKLPFKLGNITISGNKLKTIGGNALKVTIIKP
jgi:hypothetical protein